MSTVQRLLHGEPLFVLGLRSDVGGRADQMLISKKKSRLLTVQAGLDTLQTSRHQRLFLGLLSVPLAAVHLLQWILVMLRVAGQAAAPLNL